LGPYLSIYLLLTHHWDQASIGFVMGVGGIAAIIAQTPMGAFVDRTTAKRALVMAGAVTVTLGALAMPLFPRFFAISILQAATGLPCRGQGRQLGTKADLCHRIRRLDGPGASCTRSRTTRNGWSPSRSSTVSAPGFSARCSRSSCRT
jgi:hypothetical protein